VDDFNYLNYGVVLGLKQDLGFFRTSNRMDQMKAELDRFNAQRQQLIMKSKLDTERSYEEAISAVEGIKVNEDGFRAARSWLTSAGLSFNLGTSETKDVLESFAAYFKARADLIKSIYTLNLALMDLSSAAGVEAVERLKL
jgi:outer membrane protein TolC